MKPFSCAAALFAIFTLVFPLTSHAATLIVDGASGELLGAEDVDVGGVLYDVDFLDGTCIALFDGCDASDDFAFTTQAAAEAAATALQSQVFIDGPDGNFDAMPTLTAGCEAPFGCIVHTPFAVSIGNNIVNTIGYVNIAAPGGFQSANQLNRDLDLAGVASDVYASWGLSEIAPVPLPATGWLILSGLAGLFFAKRRRAA